MEERIIIAGFGGQGVLSLGQLIAYSAIHEGKEVTWLPSYGPEMRGGTSNCSIVVSDKAVASPIISHPDCLIAMNKPSLEKFIELVKPDGLVIVNSSLITEKISRKDVKAIYVKANDIAEETGSIKNANMVALGVFVAQKKLFEFDTIANVINEKFASKIKLISQIMIAYNQGFNIGLNQ